MYRDRVKRQDGRPEPIGAPDKSASTLPYESTAADSKRQINQRLDPYQFEGRADKRHAQGFSAPKSSEDTP